ncbi:MAG: ABC transporter ATP-binding protein [Anaerolineales bacterium]|jgi:putative ABC transport system ATP-binding protein|nr:ABC transporter ATP-binding protein [Anaerolineales bacterium]MDP7644042.1 ABC transporter ATP-binding protein [Anaerolineales bacterium]|tara:strand:- start:410 stop:1147 length:738 start_codon:yes stop_codon:yes gene_type:complete
MQERPESTPTENGIVRLSAVDKTFHVGDSAVRVLKDISFSVQAGEFVSVVGPSGSGKSTLLNMMTGIDAPSTGEVVVTGRAIHAMSENALAAWRGENVGIIFQFFQMLPALNLLQNVILPMDFAAKYPRHERSDRAAKLLRMVGLADQLHKLPNMVSGGQQQRAAIARALANDPPLLVTDEPTGNLDGRTADDVFELFLRLSAQGKTIIMVTHNTELAGRVPRLIEVSDGRIARDERTGATVEVA